MGELRRGLDLTHEALATERSRDVRPHHLDRHRPVVLEVLGEIDGGHGARPELALDAVAVGESRGQALQGVGHASSPYRV
jgi:hypothetical protein